MTTTVKVEKTERGYTFTDKDGNGYTIAKHDADMLYQYMKENKNNAEA